MVSHQVRPIVRKAALHFVSAVFTSFSLGMGGRAIGTLPENMLDFAVELSAAPPSTAARRTALITEFFGALRSVEMPANRSACTSCARESASARRRQISRGLQWLPFTRHAFALSVSSEVAAEWWAVQAVMQRIVERTDEQPIPVLRAFAPLDPEGATAPGRGRASRRVPSRSDLIVFTCSVLAAMMLGEFVPPGQRSGRSFMNQMIRLAIAKTSST
jgi:hypothetical protein